MTKKIIIIIIVLIIISLILRISMTNLMQKLINNVLLFLKKWIEKIMKDTRDILKDTRDILKEWQKWIDRLIKK